jgi:hypothetical protein
MNRLTCLLGLGCALFMSLAMGPVAVAAPEPFTLGAPAPAPDVLPVKPPATATKPAGKAKPAVKPTTKLAGNAKAKASGKAAKGKQSVASKTRSRKSSDVIASDIPAAKIDLTLPKDMVNQLQPPGKAASARAATPVQASAEGKPLLPSLFAPKGSAEPFELNGRLLTNEMDLQLRNERRDVEGAALDFKFKQ